MDKAKILRFKNSVDGYNHELIAKDFLDSKKTIFVVLANLYEAQKYYDGLSQILPPEQVLFYPTDQILTTIMALGSPEFKLERIYTLRQLITNKPFVVVMTQHGVTKRQLTPQDYINSVINLQINKQYDLSKLSNTLVANGYMRNYLVEKPGEFSVRGNIIDIYPLDLELPYRLDFFGDELETIKSFDINTQLSNESVSQLEVIPTHEIFYTDVMKYKAQEDITKCFSKFTLSKREQDKLNLDLEHIDSRRQQETLAIYVEFFNKDRTTIVDFSKNSKTYYIDLPKMLINDSNISVDLAAYSKTMDGNSFSYLNYQVSLEEVLLKPHIEIDNIGINNLDAMDLKIMGIPNFGHNLDLMFENLKSYITRYTINFHVSDPKRQKELIDFFLIKEVPINLKVSQEPPLNIIETSRFSSYISVKEKLIIINEETIFDLKKKTTVRYRSVINQSTKIRNINELEIGDYVVHYDYGIGKYMGLRTLGLSGNKRDYLYLLYAGDETLYIPIDQVDMVLKYGSFDGFIPKLTKIGSKAWDKTKANARKQVKELSDKLLKLYAARNQALGYSFSEDTELQKEFENDFEFLETKDQLQAINDVKEDMHSPKPMDRLIIGDVGFGKTEVALRASFKAVIDSKQVAYLVPTTVLARQHYHTFKKRFEKYGATVELLSRFVTKKHQLEVIDRLSKGLVDVVIGTHRLLSKDIKFKDLGLMIVDEEQRFGVEHKERIKEMKVNVDTLTLSATPIPRTLQMSIMGLKDLSMIDTPPLNRYPVQTYVVERNDSLIKEAITREIARGGQIFYLYNRVEDIELMVAKLNKIAPEARIAFAHGKMSRNQLENVLTDFIDHNYDILVSTTIIETGIDIPNTNTLLIHEADKLGLSQLYQIRGRVGRSDKIAYAYLFYDGRKDINNEALKRLSVIEDFTELGSGYNIALRDLSIRGAGDILGSEQSGFIDSVGLELYMKLLDEAVTGIPLKSVESDAIDQVYSNRTIDDKYINSDSVRLEIHKRISNQNSVYDLEQLELELKDRFGDFDPELVEYMYEKLLKQLSHKLGVEKTVKKAQSITFILSIAGSSKINGVKLFEFTSVSDYAIKLGYIRERIEITIDLAKIAFHWLLYTAQILEEILLYKDILS